MTKPHLGKIGDLADSLKEAAEEVVAGMVPNLDCGSFDYLGSAHAVHSLSGAIANLAEFQAGWIS